MNVKTPGVYIKEQRTLPVAVAGVSTAVPLFIGFTEIHHAAPKSIANLAEFEAHFGGGYAPQFTITSVTNGIEMVADRRFFLYDSLHAYFKNGGGPCHVCSAGDYTTSIASSDFRDDLEAAMGHITALDEVTLIFIPDLHAQYNDNGVQENILDSAHYSYLITEAFNICSNLQDKFAVFDYYKASTTAADTRTWINPDQGKRKYGAVYYPWLVSSDAYPVPFDAITGYSNTAAQPILDLDGDLNLFLTTFNGTTVEEIKTSLRNARALFDAVVNHNSNQERTELRGMLVALVDLVIAMETLADPGSAATAALRTELTNVQSNAAFIAEVQKILRLIGVLNSENPYNYATSPTQLNSNFINSVGNQFNYPSDTWINYPNANPVLDPSDLRSETSIMNVSVVDNMTRTDAANGIETGLFFDINRFYSFIVGVANNLQQRKDLLVQQLFQTDATYLDIQNAIQAYMKQIPSQGAVAGIYCRNDRDRGVWKSPANMGVQGIEKPLVEVSNSEQDDLNVHTTGKSINVIRTFTGKGPVVWGARTWDGESGEWKYIAVRRFFNFAEESIKKALNHFLFEPNNARTWVKIQAMITGFLIDYWQAGALVGTKPEEAFFVRVDKTTTTDAEILQGIVNIEVGMAVARPAEFIIIEFSHKTNA